MLRISQGRQEYIEYFESRLSGMSLTQRLGKIAIYGWVLTIFSPFFYPRSKINSVGIGLRIYCYLYKISHREVKDKSAFVSSLRFHCLTKCVKQFHLNVERVYVHRFQCLAPPLAAEAASLIEKETSALRRLIRG